MNDNFAGNHTPDSDDRYGDFVIVVIEGDSTHTLSESDFPLIYP
jgi:hypothetical protein